MIDVVTEINPDIGTIAKQINAEFNEMPGLRLSEAQVRRRWTLSLEDSRDALDCLCASGQLAHDASGRYLLGWDRPRARHGRSSDIPKSATLNPRVELTKLGAFHLADKPRTSTR